MSLRGESGDRNVAQVPFNQALPRILFEVGIPSTWIARGEDVELAVQECARSAFRWGMPAAAVLTRAATGGIEE